MCLELHVLAHIETPDDSTQAAMMLTSKAILKQKLLALSISWGSGRYEMNIS